MFGPIGFPELMIILVVALIVFGPRKLPELGRSLGRSLNEFKRASNELKQTLDDEIRLDEQRESVKNDQREAAGAPALPSTDPSRLESPAAPETIARGHLESTPDTTPNDRPVHGA